MNNERQNVVHTEITQVTDKIKKLQRTIAAVNEPVSQLELFELQRLGREYGMLIAQLKRIKEGDSNES